MASYPTSDIYERLKLQLSDINFRSLYQNEPLYPGLYNKRPIKLDVVIPDAAWFQKRFTEEKPRQLRLPGF